MVHFGTPLYPGFKCITESGFLLFSSSVLCLSSFLHSLASIKGTRSLTAAQKELFFLGFLIKWHDLIVLNLVLLNSNQYRGKRMEYAQTVIYLG